MRPGARASSIPNCSAITSGAWFGSITPPAPSRMRSVSAVSRAIIRGGEATDRPGMAWCSDIQKR